MNYCKIVVAFILISLNTKVKGQFGDLFNNTASFFCHNKNEKLLCFNDKNYLIKFHDQKLISYRSMDSLITYENNLIKFKVNDDSSVNLILSPTGLVLDFYSNEWQIDTTRSPLKYDNGDSLHTFEAIRLIGGLFFSAHFENKILDYISLKTGSHFVKIYIDKYIEGYSWSFKDSIPEYTINVIFDKDFNARLINTHNYQRKLGITISSKFNRREANFDMIYANLRPNYSVVVQNNTLVSYNARGRAKQKSALIPIKVCSCY